MKIFSGENPQEREGHLLEVEKSMKHLSEDQLRVLIGTLPENPNDTHFRELIPSFADVSDENVKEIAIRVLSTRPF